MGNLFSVSISCDTVFSHCRDCSGGKALYLYQLEKNLDALQTSLQKLDEARNDVMTRVIFAEQQQMKRLNQVQGWLSRVEAVETEVGELIKDSSQELARLCLGGLCSKSCKSSYKFAKKVTEKLQVVRNLKGEGDFKDVAERVPEDPVDERPIEPTIIGLRSMFDKVWRCIGEEQVGIIGLYGMGGVGKTTLLTQINNKFLDASNDFDVVIWAVVSKDMQTEKIQEDIGKKIGLLGEMWKNKRIEEKAMDIFKILNKKKFVLLLDDLWERVDLTKVGVPLPGSKIASKIMFTTRFMEICGQMEAGKKFKVELLTHEESWNLFQAKVCKETLDSHPDIPELAETVAKECNGLPLALITIGRAMACKMTVEEWKYAVQVLRTRASEFPGMGKEVYPLLKFSYDSLSNDRIRYCFLYCCLFPEDYKINKKDLIDCWFGEGFLEEFDESEEQNQGYYIIGILLHACLLEEELDDCVKMHDVIRDMALWIACEIEKEKENFLVHAGTGLTDVAQVRKWEGVRRISLMSNRIKKLSTTPNCTQLQTLFLNSNHLKMISGDFFQFMPSLKVLNLSYNRRLSKLPSGISTLVSLQHLNLSHTGIRELPEELKALENLKCLNLEFTHELCEIPRQVLSSFLMLRVLRMLNCYYFQVARDNILSGGRELLVEELLHLRHLNVLEITLGSANELKKILTSPVLQNCAQSLGIRYLEDSKSLNVLSLAEMKNLKKLHVTDCTDLEELKIDLAGVQKMQGNHGFHSLHSVHTSNCSKLRDLTWVVFAQNLKFIHVQDCSNLEEIINNRKFRDVATMMANQNPFSKLEHLVLEYLPNLKCIYPNALSFPHLKEITVAVCPMLKKLPLDSNSSYECKISIRGQYEWWTELQWEDQATQDAFIHCFKSYRT